MGALSHSPPGVLLNRPLREVKPQTSLTGPINSIMIEIWNP